MSKALTVVTRTSVYPAPEASEPRINELLIMHSYARPAGSKTEAAFCARFLDKIPGMYIDGEGNRIIKVGENPTILWSSHTDTVHAVGGRSRLLYGDGILSLAEGDPASCLGADCTVGVWLMVQMIRRSVPGLYIFHAGEEIGGVGSDYIAKRTPDLLKGINFAIALDRRGVNSVITSQFGGVCCSDEFAEALARFLGGRFEPDTGGTFTDTANYRKLVPECTNLSVGYYGAHSSAETLDVSFAVHLLERLCVLDASDLPVKRDPTAPPVYAYKGKYGGHYYSSAEIGGKKEDTLADLVFDHPQIAAEILEEYGITVTEYATRVFNKKWNQGGWADTY